MCNSLISVILFFALSSSLLAETLTGRVVSIADGDTLTLLDASNSQHRIRLSGIDAPEKNQDFGKKSKTNLSALAFGQPAQADCRKEDRYQRRICVVFVDGKDIGLEQVRAGMAWWYEQYSKDQTSQERADYSQAEFMAKIHRDGLWNSKNPIPPWDWRRTKD
jgi:endonuclease YncB( thermonuclease family)